MFVDVHCHLDSNLFDDDRDAVIARARERSVTVVAAGVNPETNRFALGLAQKHAHVLCSLGIYPKEAFEYEKKEYAAPVSFADFSIDAELRWMKEQIKNGFVRAVGEIGLDFVNIKDDLVKVAHDEELFRKQLRLAKKYDLPVVVHSRKAEDRVLEILEQEQMQKVVLHAFGGRKALVRKIAERRWICSIPPILPRSSHFQMIVQLLPTEQLLTETDAPYLGPIVGERNEPKNVVETVAQIAAYKGISVRDAETIIYSAFLRVF